MSLSPDHRLGSQSSSAPANLIAAHALLLAALLGGCGGGAELLLPGDGEPARIRVVHGGEQSGRVGEPLGDSLVFEVTDSRSRPIEGVQVAFELTSASPGADVLPDTAQTDANGHTYARMVLGTTIGVLEGEARVLAPEGTEAPATTFRVTALPEDANGIAVLSGDNQTGAAGSALAQPLVVQVTDAFGNPISGVPVAWTAEGGGSVSETSNVTDSEGRASVQRTLGPTAGPQATLATSPDLAGSPVSFAHTATPGNVSGLSIVSGNNQTTQAGTRLPADLVVQLVDAAGNAVPGAAVTWVVATGGGSVTPQNGITDAAGQASAEWTLGPNPGQNRLDAVVSGVGVANFTATGTAAAVPTSTIITSDSPDPSVAGQVVTVGFRVDAGGVIPTGSVTVTDGAQSCTGTLSGGLGSCQLGLTTLGQRTLRATYSGAAGLTGSSGTAIHQVNPPSGNTPPVASFNQRCEGLTCQFTDASSDPDGRVVAWSWNFGDGRTTNERGPAHTYTTAGTYPVTLTVTDDDGASDQFSSNVVVQEPTPPENQPPTAAFIWSCDQLTCSFDSEGSSDSDGRISSLSWDFGDGDRASDRKPRHTYNSAGTFTVTLTVTDDDGASNAVSHQVTATAPPPPDNKEPHAEFEVACENLTCTFSDQSRDDDGTIVSRVWNYGDGTPPSSVAAHTYAAPGRYTVTLTVTDDRGGTDSRERDASPTAPPAENQAPTAAFSTSCPAEGLTCSFNSDGSSDDGTIVSRSWNFGDGSGSNEPDPSHTYAAGGTYTVTLTVQDDDGADDSEAHEVTVTAPPPPNQAPTAAFNPPGCVTGEACVFNDASSDSDGSVVSWNWNFGEGSPSSEQNPTHIYGSSGTYTVTLSVRDDDGVQSSEVQHTVIVTDPSSSESIAQTSLSNSQGQ